MERWEYAVVEWLWDRNAIQYFLPDGSRSTLKGSYAEVVNLLTTLGREGWEVAGNTASSNWVFWTLKRPSR